MTEPIGNAKKLSARPLDAMAQVLGQRRRSSAFSRLEPQGPMRGALKAGTSEIRGAPICAGGASPLRVATGGNASWRHEARCRRSPAPANETARVAFRSWVRRRGLRPGRPSDGSGLLAEKKG